MLLLFYYPTDSEAFRKKLTMQNDKKSRWVDNTAFNDVAIGHKFIYSLNSSATDDLSLTQV